MWQTILVYDYFPILVLQKKTNLIKNRSILKCWPWHPDLFWPISRKLNKSISSLWSKEQFDMLLDIQVFILMPIRSGGPYVFLGFKHLCRWLWEVHSMWYSVSKLVLSNIVNKFLLHHKLNVREWKIHWPTRNWTWDLPFYLVEKYPGSSQNPPIWSYYNFVLIG